MNKYVNEMKNAWVGFATDEEWQDAVEHSELSANWLDYIFYYSIILRPLQRLLNRARVCSFVAGWRAAKKEGESRLSNPLKGDVFKLSSHEWFIFEFGKWRLMNEQEQLEHGK